jgi:hypothetical protein
LTNATNRKKDLAMDDFAAEIDRLRKQMQPPQKANSLLLVERNLAKLKGERAGIAEQLKLAQAADVRAGLMQPSPSVRRLTEQVEKVDDAINGVRRELAAARETQSRELTKALEPATGPYVELLHLIIDELDQAAGLGIEVANYAAKNGLTIEAPAVRNSLLVSRLVRDLRLAASGSVR